jgi:hypothetical protein
VKRSDTSVSRTIELYPYSKLLIPDQLMFVIDAGDGEVLSLTKPIRSLFYIPDNTVRLYNHMMVCYKQPTECEPALTSSDIMKITRKTGYMRYSRLFRKTNGCAFKSAIEVDFVQFRGRDLIRGRLAL